MATRYFLAGHRGMVGSAILRALQDRRAAGEPLEVITQTRGDLDLTDAGAVLRFMRAARPDVVILAAAKVGGIHANNIHPAEFIHQNLAIALNVIHSAHEAGVRRLLQLGSSCIYPREAPQPIPEAALLTGPLEPTNEPYAIAKIAAIKLCESYNRQYGRDYRSIMPCNLYGPGDNFHPDNSHVIPALMGRFYEAVENGAESVTIWGSGTPRREFLHVDDMAAASLFVLGLSAARHAAHTRAMLSHINVGSGHDIPILELARRIAAVTGFRGRILTDPSKPDGTPRKLLDTRCLTALGWQPRISLDDGLAQTYSWFRTHAGTVRA